MNHRAWDGINILVYGRKAGAPGQLEQIIAEAAPELETTVDSFENYEPALDYCKNTKSVGFFLLQEDNHTPPQEEIFRNLVKPYEKSGWPGFAALIHSGPETIQGVRTTLKSPRFIGYLSETAFVDARSTAFTLSDLWDRYINGVSDFFVGKGVENTLLSTASSYLPEGSLLFHDQALTVLSDNLALSWKDMFILKWHLAVTTLQANLPQALTSHPQFVTAVTQSTTLPDSSLPLVERLKNQATPLRVRVLDLITELNKRRAYGELENVLNDVASLTKPGAPAIFRQIAKCKSALLNVSAQRRTG